MLKACKRKAKQLENPQGLFWQAMEMPYVTTGFYTGAITLGCRD